MEKEFNLELIEPNNQWEMWLQNHIEETGVDNCGLFCNAKSEKEAKKIFKALIKIIQNGKRI